MFTMCRPQGPGTTQMFSLTCFFFSLLAHSNVGFCLYWSREGMIRWCLPAAIISIPWNNILNPLLHPSPAAEPPTTSTAVECDPNRGSSQGGNSEESWPPITWLGTPSLWCCTWPSTLTVSWFTQLGGRPPTLTIGAKQLHVQVISLQNKKTQEHLGVWSRGSPQKALLTCVHWTRSGTTFQVRSVKELVSCGGSLQLAPGTA